MEKEIYNEVILAIMQELVNSEHKELSPIEEGGEPIRTDIGDVGNTIGIAVGEFIVKHGWNKEEFISGIKHGISLKDGTH
jgi:hypothetical protein